MGEQSRSQDDDGVHTAEYFAKFFTDKIDAVRTTTSSTPLQDVSITATHVINNWTSERQNRLGTCLILPSARRANLIPNRYGLSGSTESYCRHSSLFVNESITTGCLLAEDKHAIVTPLLKKSNQDASLLKSYRPVSNLTFLSKLLEKVIKSQLQVYMDDNDAMPKHQSAYRRYHSIETALVKVYNGLLMATDNGQISAVCLLDLTAAFDMVDHDLLLQRLERGFGIKGLALSWFKSYLTSRTFCVVYAGTRSTTTTVTCSVPQRSVLGPLLFNLYTADLSELANKHGVTRKRLRR